MTIDEPWELLADSGVSGIGIELILASSDSLFTAPFSEERAR